MPVTEPVQGSWYSVAEAAEMCHRAERTIRDLIYRRKVPKRIIRYKPRRPVIYLSADAVRYLQSITLKL